MSVGIWFVLYENGIVCSVFGRLYVQRSRLSEWMIEKGKRTSRRKLFVMMFFARVTAELHSQRESTSCESDLGTLSITSPQTGPVNG